MTGEWDDIVVGAGDDLVLAAKIEHCHHGTEDFFARDGHVIGDIRKDRGRQEESRPIQPLATADKPLAVCDALLDIAFDDVELALGDVRSEGRPLVYWVTDPCLFQPYDQSFKEGVPDVALQKDAYPVRADLTGRLDIAEYRAVHRIVEIGVGKDY
jgi:hypothetical protein